MPIKIIKRYTREFIRANPDDYFVAGDNCHREGNGGQMKEARNEPNTIGIVTKRTPQHKEESYFSDKFYNAYTGLIEADFKVMESKLKDGKLVYWPEDGIGTGLSKLPELAPLIYKYIEDRFEQLKQQYGVIE